MLNAFQHQRSNHYRPPLSPVPWYQCSTLFSIKDQITCYSILWSIICCSAQRFSASKIKSLISIIFTASIVRVLNAFQHQRSNHMLMLYALDYKYKCSTLFSIKDQITIDPPCPLFPGTSAQRFSASKIKSLAIQSCGQSFAAVLNAFQHQRSNH